MLFFYKLHWELSFLSVLRTSLYDLYEKQRKFATLNTYLCILRYSENKK